MKNDRDKFISQIELSIDSRCVEIISNKSPEIRSLDYTDAQAISLMVKHIFLSRVGSVPSEISDLMAKCEQILAPSSLQISNIIKALIGIIGSASGLGLLLYVVMDASGKNKSISSPGMFERIVDFFAGKTQAAQVQTNDGIDLISLLVAALCLVGVSSLIAFLKSPQKRTEKYCKTIKRKTRKTIEKIWDKYSDDLTAENINGDKK